MAESKKRGSLRNNALRINEKDNVAIATRAIAKGEPVIVNREELGEAAESIKLGHKIALVPIGLAESVVRYGEEVVRTTSSIARGEWVHVHNTEPIPGDLQK